LFEGGVLPELKLTYTRRSADAPRPQGAGSEGSDAAAHAAAAAIPQIDLGALATEITKLLTASRPRPAGIDQGAVELDASVVDKRLSQVRDPGTIDSQQFGQAVRRMPMCCPIRSRTPSIWSR
jgi:hypothetical protein